MQSNTRTFILVTVVGTAVLVGCNLAELRVPGGVAKMTASAGFLLTAWSVGAVRWRYGQIMFVGLVLSAFGDAFLIGSGDTFFLLGLVSFLTAHVCYTVAFVHYGQRWRWTLAIVPFVAALSIGVGWWLDGYVGADMKWPVRVYTTVISLMVVFAFGARGHGAPWLVFIGALLFYLSDLSVASGQFVQPAFPNYVWGLPFYFGGQICLALTANPAYESRSAASA